MSLPSFARLYLQGAEATRAGELCGLTQYHPACDCHVKVWLDEVLPLVQDALSPAELEKAMERGKTLDLDTMVAELLEEFGEDNA